MIAEDENRGTGCLKGKVPHAAIKIKTTLEDRNPLMPLHKVAVPNRVRLTAQLHNKTHNAETIALLASGAMDSKAAQDRDETGNKAVNGATANLSKVTQDNDAMGNNKAIPGKDVTIGNRVTLDRDAMANNSVGKVNRAHIKRIVVIVTVTDNHLHKENARISTGMAHNDKTITSVGTAPNKVTDNNGMELHLAKLGKDAKASRATTRDVMVNRASDATVSKATTRGATDNRAIIRDATDNKVIFNGETDKVDNKVITNGATDNRAIIRDATDNKAIISGATGNKAVSSVQMGKPEQVVIRKEAGKVAGPKPELTNVGKAARAAILRKMIKGPAVSLVVAQNHHTAKKMIKNPTNHPKTIENNNFKKPNKHG